MLQQPLAAVIISVATIQGAVAMFHRPLAAPPRKANAAYLINYEYNVHIPCKK